MKKLCCLLIGVLFVCVFLSGCGSQEEQYVDVLKAYVEERYSVGLEEGQETWVKIVQEDDIEAYVYCGGGLMYGMKKGALEAYKNEESVSPYIISYFPGKGSYSAPTEEELNSDWENFES